MRYSTLKKVYFSPGGTTASIINKIAAHFQMQQSEHNLLKESAPETPFADSELLVVAAPVFSGRIPDVYIKKLKKLKGNDTPAIIVAVYGNRDYEDALVELKDTLESNGFVVIAAAAFIARHSIFPQVAVGRPDAKDDEVIANFAKQSLKRLEQYDPTTTKKTLKVKGNTPYRKVGKIPLKPSANSKCNNCGACVKVCPVGAIDLKNQKIYDKTKCISCAACISVCKHSARNFRGLLYWFVQRKFVKSYSVRQEPDLFL